MIKKAMSAVDKVSNCIHFSSDPTVLEILQPVHGPHLHVQEAGKHLQSEGVPMAHLPALKARLQLRSRVAQYVDASLSETAGLSLDEQSNPSCMRPKNESGLELAEIGPRAAFLRRRFSDINQWQTRFSADVERRVRVWAEARSLSEEGVTRRLDMSLFTDRQKQAVLQRVSQMHSQEAPSLLPENTDCGTASSTLEGVKNTLCISHAVSHMPPGRGSAVVGTRPTVKSEGRKPGHSDKAASRDERKGAEVKASSAPMSKALVPGATLPFTVATESPYANVNKQHV
jgi:hypothetical protein